MNIGNSALYYTAAATTALAGILHLILVPDIIGRNLNSGVFFIVAGIAQIFWVIPMLKRWGRIWYYIGIAGTIVLIIMWVMTRAPGNPITGRGGPISEMAIAIEVFQIAYVVITAIIIKKERNREIQTIKQKKHDK
ncbi:MAG: hypothetical protein M3224_07540 [Thermoproteota archaeon]|jgi:hypothetical protein|nr:hypothetical protein [Thermoproteota archaeon]